MGVVEGMEGGDNLVRVIPTRALRTPITCQEHRSGARSYLINKLVVSGRVFVAFTNDRDYILKLGSFGILGFLFRSCSFSSRRLRNILSLSDLFHFVLY